MKVFHLVTRAGIMKCYQRCFMRRACFIIIAAVLGATGVARAGTVLDFWHSYTPPQTGQKHWSFHLTNCKRGIFFGSCGISTKSLRWAYQFDLTGDGPDYAPSGIQLTDGDLKPVRIVAGKVVIGDRQGRAVVDLEVEQGGVTNRFIGNGTFKIRKLD